MTGNIHISDREAQLLSLYLTGKECNAELADRYAAAVSTLNAVLNASQQTTWDKMMSSRVYLKTVDSGLAITSPQSPLRKRIFIMLAILEASTEFTDYFLPQERSLFYLIPLGLRTGMSALYLIFGTLMVKAIKIT